MAKRVLLLGAGAGHLALLQALGRQPLPGADVALVTPWARQVFAPWVPAVVSGRVGADACSIALAPLVAAARVHLIEAQVTALDADARRAQLSDGRVVDCDLLSLDTEPFTDRDRLPGARAHGLFLRPAEHFVRLLEGLWDLAAQRVLDVVVVGGGTQAVELALALAQRLSRGGDERARVALVTGGGEPVASLCLAAQQRVQRALAQSRVTVFREPCRAVEPGAVVLGSGARLACDAPVLAASAEPPAWLQGSGLALDGAGWVDAGATLQSRSHPMVLALGAVASDAHAVLAHNLRAQVGGGPLRAVKSAAPPPVFVDIGHGRAVLAWGGHAAQGRWVGWWKQARERRWLAGLSPRA